MSGIISRKVDKKGRVVIPFKDAREVYMFKADDVVIVSPDRNKVLEYKRMLERIKKERKLKAIEEWFSLVESAGLSKLEVEDLKRLLNRSIIRELE